MKGQTHLATMLLNTFWYGHSSMKMLPWLLGQKANASAAGDRDRRRLVQSYVAMTRPTHLICLAVLRSTFGKGRVFADQLVALASRGWCVAEIVDGGTEWRA